MRNAFMNNRVVILLGALVLFALLLGVIKGPDYAQAQFTPPKAIAQIGIAGQGWDNFSCFPADGGGATTCNFPEITTGAGHTLVLFFFYCNTGACTTPETDFTLSISDGGDTFTQISGAQSPGVCTLCTHAWFARSVMGGSVTVTVKATGGTGTGFNYGNVWWIDLTGGSASDASVANYAASPSMSITSSGTVSEAGEIILVAINACSAITPTGYFLVLSPFNANDTLGDALLYPAVGTSPTATVTVSGGGTFSMVGIKP